MTFDVSNIHRQSISVSNKRPELGPRNYFNLFVKKMFELICKYFLGEAGPSRVVPGIEMSPCLTWDHLG